MAYRLMTHLKGSRFPSSSLRGIGTGIPASFGKRDFQSPAKRGHYITGVFFVMASMFLYFHWVAFTLTNSPHVDGNTQHGPPSDGIPKSNRYEWEWWTIWLLTLNLLLPYLLAASLLNNTTTEYIKLHYSFSRYIGVGLNFIVFALLTVQWLIWCNGASGAQFSVCNDARWCCAHNDAEWCPNVVCNPAVSTGDLRRSNVGFNHWLFSLLFLLHGLFSRGINSYLRNKGLFFEVFEEEEGEFEEGEEGEFEEE